MWPPKAVTVNDRFYCFIYHDYAAVSKPVIYRHSFVMISTVKPVIYGHSFVMISTVKPVIYGHSFVMISTVKPVIYGHCFWCLFYPSFGKPSLFYGQFSLKICMAVQRRFYCTSCSSGKGPVCSIITNILSSVLSTIKWEWCWLCDDDSVFVLSWTELMNGWSYWQIYICLTICIHQLLTCSPHSSSTVNVFH